MKKKTKTGSMCRYLLMFVGVGVGVQSVMNLLNIYQRLCFVRKEITMKMLSFSYLHERKAERVDRKTTGVVEYL